MADNLKISSGDNEDVNAAGRDYSEKLQGLARAVVSGLYMLTRSVKMYEPENSIFDRPLIALQDAINQVISRENRLELLGVKQSLYLNGMLVKVDQASLGNVSALLDEWRSRDVTGFTLMRPVQVDELKNFVSIFRKEQTGHAEDDGIPGKKLMSIKIARWSRLKDKLEKDPSTQKKLDRKKYALMVYARAVFFVYTYMESMKKGQPLNTAQALRIIQDFVDVMHEMKTHFLGMTTMKPETDYLAYHQVNVCLMAIVFGMELGLSKRQLRDLGYIAMFHDAGMCTVSAPMLAKPERLSPEERAVVAKAPLITVQNILREKGLNRATLQRVVTTFEHKMDFGVPVRDPKGNITQVTPRADLGLFSRVIAICAAYDALTSRRPFREAYGPEISLQLMWTEMRNKFDPALLTVFMKVMAIQPIKVLAPRERMFTLGGL